MSCNKFMRICLSLITLHLAFIFSGSSAAAELQANDLANDLRMLSQRILISYSQLEQGVEYIDAGKHLQESITEYDQTLSQLGANDNSEDAQQALAELREAWGKFRRISMTPPTPQNSQTLFGLGEQLQSMAYELFEIYEDDAGEEHGVAMDEIGQIKFLAHRISMLYTYKVRGFNTDDSLLAITFKDLEKSVTALRKHKKNSDHVNKQLDETRQSLALLQRSISISNTDLSFTVGMTTGRIIDTAEKLTEFYMEKQEAPAQN
ncbi:MAG: type IV pili methyl-accepting chemotaxis transducer N-terminal domain-containing protein [Chromatiales bacterium]|nr:type IV pili methyl-accepting chemotaxis transducer N-terminal domain-containing protein [Chromatiales bacterium]